MLSVLLCGSNMFFVCSMMVGCNCASRSAKVCYQGKQKFSLIHHCMNPNNQIETCLLPLFKQQRQRLVVQSSTSSTASASPKSRSVEGKRKKRKTAGRKKLDFSRFFATVSSKGRLSRNCYKTASIVSRSVMLRKNLIFVQHKTLRRIVPHGDPLRANLRSVLPHMRNCYHLLPLRKQRRADTAKITRCAEDRPSFGAHFSHMSWAGYTAELWQHYLGEGRLLIICQQRGGSHAFAMEREIAFPVGFFRRGVRS